MEMTCDEGSFPTIDICITVNFPVSAKLTRSKSLCLIIWIVDVRLHEAIVGHIAVYIVAFGRLTAVVVVRSSDRTSGGYSY